MKYAPGSFVHARERDWIVLPESREDLLFLRPLAGSDGEIAGIYLPLETVTSAQFPPPNPERPGDHRACYLLREAARLGFRSSAGPFRSFGRIAVTPRPYQLVPLLMALKLDPVRLLIADDVGVGKTIEACLIARELLDRGEIHRIAVLCLPQLAEQWQKELEEKFHIPAELVLPSTASRLEHRCQHGQSLFELCPYVVVSTDFIKSERRLDDFLRTCPEMVIVDEAHTCAQAGEGRGQRHQRHRLLKGLASDPGRHLLLVTATPHSGDENAFRSLLQLLQPDFATLPEDLSGPHNESCRRRLAAHLIQRRRADIRHYLHDETPFPQREEAEESYALMPEYRRLFEKALRYARETVTDPTLGQHRRRVRWWSALALLRSLASSPEAAAATLRNRAAVADTQTPEDADHVGRKTVMDLIEDESLEDADLTPGSDEGAEDEPACHNRRHLLEMAHEAEQLRGTEHDAKLCRAIQILKQLLKEGFHPIVFCRFIPTAEYVACNLRQHIKDKDVTVVAVTGTLPPAEREERIRQMAAATKRILVCTDCLSEGINLQEYFTAVVHYDLAWNPTRHEQREGRVDRYGQTAKTVRALTYYGRDNQIDGIVLDVLLRKHRTIRKSLGISVPVPVHSEQVLEAIFEGLLLRSAAGTPEQQLELQFDELLQQQQELHTRWDNASEREKRSRTLFAQESIHPEEVFRELQAVHEAIGSPADTRRFLQQALPALGAHVDDSDHATLQINLAECPTAVRDAMGLPGPTTRPLRARFTLPTAPGEIYLTRTHPCIEGLASYLLNSALDPIASSPAARCGVIRTHAVARRTTLLLIRYRFLLTAAHARQPLLAEDLSLLAFEGPPQNPLWLPAERAEQLLQATPSVNTPPDQAREFLQRVLDNYPNLLPHLQETAYQRASALLQAHRRVRSAARIQQMHHEVQPQLPPDILGIYIYLPDPNTFR